MTVGIIAIAVACWYDGNMRYIVYFIKHFLFF